MYRGLKRCLHGFARFLTLFDTVLNLSETRFKPRLTAQMCQNRVFNVSKLTKLTKTAVEPAAGPGQTLIT